MLISMIRRSGLRSQWLALAFLPLLCAPLPATADVAGVWDVTEYDPFIPDNDFWGQFKYRLEIVRAVDGYRLTVPRTGARLQAPEIDEDRLTAIGAEPGRGELRLEISFADNSFEGTLFTDQNRRRVTGTLNPAAQLDRIEGSVRAAEARADSAVAEAAAVRAQRDALERQVAVLSRQVGRLRESQRATARELQIAREQLESAPEPAPAATVAAAARPATPKLTVKGPRITIIEPPFDPAREGETALSYELPTTKLIGKVAAEMGLISLRVNGQDIGVDPRGLFQASVDVGAGGTPVRIVAIDNDGRRTELSFNLLPGRPTAVPDQTDRQGAEQRCYDLAIAASTPQPGGLDACRAAIRENPGKALNHYNLGVALSRAGRHQEAVRAYQEAAGLWSR